MAICKHCGSSRDLVKTEDNDYICTECIRRFDYVSCNLCSKFYIREDGKYRCNRCEDEIYKTECNSYGCKPRTNFKTFINGEVMNTHKELGQRYYGFELEYNYLHPSKAKTYGSKLYKERFMYNKRDGSISSGVEIVTAPMDKRVFKTYFLKEASKLLKYIDRNIDSYSCNAGVHIHVNVKSIPVIDRYKLHCLLNLTMDRQEANALYFLCGRDSEYSGTSERNYSYCTAGYTNRINYKRNRERHIALNTQNEKTFEFRLFKSSAKPEILLSYVEIVDKLLEYTNTHGLSQITVTNFIGWLKDNTSNSIILDKVNTILNTKLLKRSSMVVSSQELLQYLKGIKYTDYLRVISAIECHTGDRGSTRNINMGYIRDCYSAYEEQSSEPKSSLSKILYTTYKKVLINKIMKEVYKCA